MNPNKELVEVNARQTVFYPEKPGINYITVDGFTLEQAATPWSPPTAEQIGLIGTHWSKGWVIENNTVRYSVCTGISLGKYGDEFDNTSQNSAVGYVETINRALKHGWSKDNIGHHIVRNNHIYHCEQAGIVGSLGAVFSTITGNEIHDIHVRCLFSGMEMGGIKIHGAIDTVISDNHIYRTWRGIWLDWMAQGTRVTGNLLHDNQATQDLFLEVNHGPHLIDNNLFLSGNGVYDISHGGAYVHNLFAGRMIACPNVRVTPYHKAHSTKIAGMDNLNVGDDRFYNNIFVSPDKPVPWSERIPERLNNQNYFGLATYNEATLPVYMAGNVFYGKAEPSKHEKSPLREQKVESGFKLVEKSDGCYLEMQVDPAWIAKRKRNVVTSDALGETMISKLSYVQPDGSPYKLDTDYFGNKRNNNPTPGPFEELSDGKMSVKVWPAKRLESAGRSESKPNILIIFTDDQGYRDLGCYGSPTNLTPRMDKLASEGVKFMDFYAQSVCGPSRSALLTGRNPSLSLGWRMPAEEITWAELIKGAGYQTACIGKWDVSNRKETIERMPNAQGFDYYFGTLGANDNGRVKFHENNTKIGQTSDMSCLIRTYTDKSIDYLENRRDKKKPFVLYIAHNMMHTIIDASEKFKGKSKGSLYGDVVEEFDYETGRLLDTVDRLGLRDNTLVIYTTDNGPWNQPKYTTRKKGHPEGSIFWGDAGVLRNGKGTCYEGGMRAACIVRWPGRVAAGKESRAIFSTLDFMPTFARLAGFKVPDDRIIDGFDQTELLTGKNPKGARDVFFYEHMDWRNSSINGVRKGKWKYLRADHFVASYARDESIDTSEQLYNLKSDVGEKNNLAKKHPDKVLELKKMLDEYIESHKTSKPKKHLFILSGQSNMAGLNPDISFMPTVEAAFGKDNVIVVKDAAGGQPIRRWYKKWKSVKGDVPEANGALYDRLMGKVNAAIEGKHIKSVTFLWMQGERDAKGGEGDVYEASMKGLIYQLRTDMGRKDMNFVIGRLSDHLMKNPGWVTVRKAQVAVAQTDSRGEWVDTDDLNNKKDKEGNLRDDLHYSQPGYKTLGERFAKKAIELIGKN